MLEHAKLVLLERAKLQKTSKTILLDKTYHFAIPMTYSVYNENTRENALKVYQN
jgi:hypothetical protein